MTFNEIAKIREEESIERQKVSDLVSDFKEKQPTKDTLFFFYGSLRKGLYNHKPYQDKVEFIGTTEIHGYRLISLGAYPCVIKTGDAEDCVIGEVYKITDEGAIWSIDNMELNAGYKRSFENVNIRNSDGLDPESKEVLLYEYDYPETVKDKEVVEHGDWTKYKQEQCEKEGQHLYWNHQQGEQCRRCGKMFGG